MDIEGNRLPTSLEHCYIENSIVQFNYKTPFFWKYVQQKIVESMTAKGFELDEYPLVGDEMGKELSKEKMSFFTDREFKFLVEGRCISFNCVSDYSGWARYSFFIRMAMQAMPVQDLEFKSVYIRYISRYDGVPIFQKLDGGVSMNQFQDVNGAEIRFPVKEVNGISGLVRLTNMMQSIDGQHQASFADVELSYSLNTNSIDEALTACDMIHESEKKNFFRTISEEFVHELGPTY